MKIVVRAGVASWEEKWEKTPFYCPICGERRVWREVGPSDYYAGPRILCVRCGGTMQHPSADTGEIDKARKAAIKAKLGVRR